MGACSSQTLQETIKFHHFTILGILGEGGFGKVYLAKDLNDESKENLRALKLIKLDNFSAPERKEAISEASNIMAYIHSNVLKCYECFILEANLYISMEYCENGDLRSWINHKKKQESDFLRPRNTPNRKPSLPSDVVPPPKQPGT